MTDVRDWHTAAVEPKPRSLHPQPDAEHGWRQQQLRPEDDSPLAIPRDVLQKIYLSPPVEVTGDFRNAFANPTPLGLVGFLVASLPVSFQLMRIGGSGGGGAATASLSFWFGGVLHLLACMMEWVLGNTFSFLVFGTFGAAWFALSSVVQSEGAFVAAAAPLSPSEAQARFDAGFAFGLLALGLLVVTFGFCALRTNVVFVVCFGVVSAAVFLLAASYWALAAGNTSRAERMQTAAGAIFLFCCVLAWYLLVANLLEVLEFRFSLPVGDLSRRFGRAEGQAKYRDRSKSVG